MVYATLALAVGACGNGDGSRLPGDTDTDSDTDGTYIEQRDAGLDYWVYVPGSYNPNQAFPLVVFLHGCTGDALEQADMTGWARLADAERFIAVFPQAAEPLRCWFFTNPLPNSSRDSGEAGMIAAITQSVMDVWNVDPDRVYLDGYSAGGTMASVMGATYPDLYAAIAMVEGCAYLCTDETGLLAYQAMGEHARPLPVFIVTGTMGGYPAGGIIALDQWLGTADFADDGALNFSIPRIPASSMTDISERGFPYTVETYVDNRGQILIERWVVQGMRHEYPEPGGDLPDATEGAYRFFKTHPFEETTESGFGR